MPTQRPSPGRPRHRTYHTHRPAPRRVNVPPRPTRNQRGTIQIPDEVRLASTMGQTVKKCVRCGNTLDVKTAVCYFCGARQPRVQRSPTAQQPAPAVRPPAPVMLPQGHSRDTLSYCPNCGTKITRGALFCTQCGSSID